MKAKEFEELLSKGESSTLEFKRKVTAPQKLAKEISAFANTKGGMLLIGIDDDGSVYGVDSEKSAIEMIELVCGFFLSPPITPKIDVFNYKKDYIVAVTIDESSKKPHFVVLDENTSNSEKKAFIRVGENSVQASREMLRFLSSQSSTGTPLKLSIGEKEKQLFLYLEKHSKATVKDFSNLVNISRRRAERLLIRLVRAGVLHIHADENTDYFTLI